MITRATVDALQYGDIVRLEIDGEILEGPVEGKGGYKNISGRALRYAVAGLIDSDGQISTGYPEYVLARGTLTVLSTR